MLTRLGYQIEEFCVALFEAFRPLSHDRGRFRQNVWESDTGNRLPEYGWLSVAHRAVTYRSFDGVSGKMVAIPGERRARWRQSRSTFNAAQTVRRFREREITGFIKQRVL